MPQMDAGFSQPERESRQQAAAMEATWTAERRPAPASPPLPSPAQAAAGAGAWAGVRPRLAGPGGYYNVGNALGLVGGLALAVVQAGGAEGPTLGSGARAAYDHLAGSASALSVTAAMLVFFWSGEVYLRAWARGFPPDARLNRRGDLLSGWGALLLGLGLFLIGQPVLAATAGLLHAIGKFGSALHGPLPLRPGRPDPFRTAVLLSRVPALVMLAGELGSALSAPGGPVATAVAAPALLIVCYLLWAKADLMLFRT